MTSLNNITYTSKQHNLDCTRCKSAPVLVLFSDLHVLSRVSGGRDVCLVSALTCDHRCTAFVLIAALLSPSR